jgi:flagellar assembly factor FliW
MVQKLSFRYFQIEIFLVDSQIEKKEMCFHIKKGIMGFATIQIIRFLVKWEKN